MVGGGLNRGPFWAFGWLRYGRLIALDLRLFVQNRIQQ
jgi:hypothetical protein